MLNHSIETSRLAAVIAAEIGADVQIAKMGGLLHDIGKAVDHEVEGPHAAIGAADRPAPQPAVQGDQRHRRAPPGGRVRLPGGADRPDRRRDQRVAARAPAARRWTPTSSGSRTSRRSPRASSGVEKSFAVQAGREVRILVRPEEIDDLDRDAPRPRHRPQDRGAADLPGPDQGHGHPRDARRGVREVAARRSDAASSAGPGSVTSPTATRRGRSGACRVLMIGDMIGKPGRVAVEQLLPGLRDERAASTSSRPTARTSPAAWA